MIPLLNNNNRFFLILFPILMILVAVSVSSNCSAYESGLARKIVIDPMYGGTEKGPTGYNNLKGKDITLDISQRIAKLLKGEGYEVVLTRNTDKTINSKERNYIAKKNNGDIFVGIGINSFSGKNVSGVVTYFLEYQTIGTNRAFESADKKIAQQIFDDLSLKENIINSRYLAQCLSGIVSRELDIKNLGTKNAMFGILFNLNMPSAIIFIDFISNDEVANNLSIPEYRAKISNSIAEAIIKYFNASE